MSRHAHGNVPIHRTERQLAHVDFGSMHRETRADILPRYPAGMRQRMADSYLATATHRPEGLPGWSLKPWMNADAELRQRHRRLRGSAFGVAFDAGELRLKAQRCAQIALGLMRNRSGSEKLEAASRYATEQGIEAPAPNDRGITVEGCCRRLADPAWWRRKLKRQAYQQSEAVEREYGLVQARTGLYASDDAVERRRQDKARARAFLEECLAVNDLGEALSLADIADANVSNPQVRRAEFMTRVRGFEEYADRHGHAGNFLTLTTPSRFHAFRRNGDQNPRWDGSTPLDAQRWLTRTWAQIRTALSHAGVRIYGFRVAEPHHDGTPHWHMLLFCTPSQESLLLSTINRYMLAESPDEPGANQHRFNTVRIDKSRGSAAGYFAKYVSKNIDGHAVGPDLEDNKQSRDTVETVQRVETWASTWTVRQFQQIGGPPVGIWRELRRVNGPLHGLLETARQAADSGDWSAYMEAMGGHATPFRDCSIRILRVWKDDPGLYDEALRLVLIGVEFQGDHVITRHRQWRLERKTSGSGSRTCVNNCTLLVQQKWAAVQTRGPSELAPATPPSRRHTRSDFRY